MSIEIYNKPTIKYRVEGFSFFICNAWELLLKAYMIKTLGEKSIYYKDNPDRTLTLENCIKKVLTNDKDPVRINLETIIVLRNTNTHFITEEYETIYVPLFQSCVSNYINKLLTYFSCDITESLGSNFLTLSIKLDDFNNSDIVARYPKAMADKFLSTRKNVNSIIASNSSLNLAITIRHDWYLTKNTKTAATTFAFTKDPKGAVCVIKEQHDMQKSCPFSTIKCVEKINYYIKRDNINFVNPSDAKEDKKHVFNSYHFRLFIKFYDIRKKSGMCYTYKVYANSLNSYSQKVIDFIYSQIKKDPEHIISKIKTELQKKIS